MQLFMRGGLPCVDCRRLKAEPAWRRVTFSATGLMLETLIEMERGCHAMRQKRDPKHRAGPIPQDHRPNGMTVSPGRSFPLGATVVDGGVNFCVYSGRAKQLELLLFDGASRR